MFIFDVYVGVEGCPSDGSLRIRMRTANCICFVFLFLSERSNPNFNVAARLLGFHWVRAALFPPPRRI
jgi:hypothetical protein